MDGRVGSVWRLQGGAPPDLPRQMCSVPRTAVQPSHLHSLPASRLQPLTPPTQGWGSLVQKPVSSPPTLPPTSTPKPVGQEPGSHPPPSSTRSSGLGRTLARWPLWGLCLRVQSQALGSCGSRPASPVLLTLIVLIKLTPVSLI